MAHVELNMNTVDRSVDVRTNGFSANRHAVASVSLPSSQNDDTYDSFPVTPKSNTSCDSTDEVINSIVDLLCEKRHVEHSKRSVPDHSDVCNEISKSNSVCTRSSKKRHRLGSGSTTASGHANNILSSLDSEVDVDNSSSATVNSSVSSRRNSCSSATYFRRSKWSNSNSSSTCVSNMSDHSNISDEGKCVENSNEVEKWSMFQKTVDGLLSSGIAGTKTSGKSSHSGPVEKRRRLKSDTDGDIGSVNSVATSTARCHEVGQSVDDLVDKVVINIDSNQSDDGTTSRCGISEIRSSTCGLSKENLRCSLGLHVANFLDTMSAKISANLAESVHGCSRKELNELKKQVDDITSSRRSRKCVKGPERRSIGLQTMKIKRRRLVSSNSSESSPTLQQQPQQLQLSPPKPQPLLSYQLQKVGSQGLNLPQAKSLFFQVSQPASTTVLQNHQQPLPASSQTCISTPLRIGQQPQVRPVTNNGQTTMLLLPMQQNAGLIRLPGNQTTYLATAPLQRVDQQPMAKPTVQNILAAVTDNRLSTAGGIATAPPNIVAPPPNCGLPISTNITPQPRAANPSNDDGIQILNVVPRPAGQHRASSLTPVYNTAVRAVGSVQNSLQNRTPAQRPSLPVRQELPSYRPRQTNSQQLQVNSIVTPPTLPRPTGVRQATPPKQGAAPATQPAPAQHAPPTQHAKNGKKEGPDIIILSDGKDDLQIIGGPAKPKLSNAAVRAAFAQAMNNRRLTQTQVQCTTQHPAPPPAFEKQSVIPNSALRTRLPPKPELKLESTPNGLVVSWSMGIPEDTAEIVHYLLYDYPEPVNKPPNSLLWKKLGDIRALALPMACTLTNFSDGTHHFVVRGQDKYGRVGPYSNIATISL